MTFVQFPDQHIICVHIEYMLFILLVISANVVVIIADSCGRNCEIQILSEKYKQVCKSHYRNILICDTINIRKVGKTIQGLFISMLTLTLAGNNLESNSQCRCSVVAKGAWYTGVYIGGGGGGGDLKITSWSQFYCAPLFLCYCIATNVSCRTGMSSLSSQYI